MAQSYPVHCPTFSYVGTHRYLLTFVTFDRNRIFSNAAAAALALSQIRRAASEKQFDIVVYCAMPDHLHLVVEGLHDTSDLKAFVKLAKQYSGFYYAKANRRAKLWQHGSHDHIVRDDVDFLDRVRYVVNNPVAAGLAARPEDYRLLGSDRWSIPELIEWCKPRIGGGSSSAGGRLSQRLWDVG
jgi:REP element-mobilizing transposase RayT